MKNSHRATILYLTGVGAICLSVTYLTKQMAYGYSCLGAFLILLSLVLYIEHVRNNRGHQ